jgi:hypothetical protein
MNQKVTSALSRALFDSDLVASRLTLAIAEFIWGVLLFWPGETFARPTYLGMAHVMHEEAWALVFLVSAATQFSIVIQAEYHCWLARYFAAWNAVLWAYCVVSMLLSVYPPPAAISGEVALAIMATWIWVRPFILLKGIEHARSLR